MRNIDAVPESLSYQWPECMPGCVIIKSWRGFYRINSDVKGNLFRDFPDTDDEN